MDSSDGFLAAKDYTVVTVYQAAPSLGERTVWRIGIDDSLCNGLTTRRVLSKGHAFGYDSVERGLPVIATVQQSGPAVPARLTMGDSVEVRELMYFDRRLGVGMLRRVQSYLAVRHGITLGPVDYVDGHGKKVWRYPEDSLFHHRIFGFGRDSVYGLRQYEGQSCEDSLLILLCDSLPEGAYLLIGAGEEDTWKLRATRAAGLPFTLRIETQDSLVLLWKTEAEGSTLLHPTTRDSRGLSFVLTAPDSTALLTLIPAPASKNAHSSLTTYHSPLITVSPNPARDYVRVQSSESSIQSIQVYDTQGHLVHQAILNSQFSTLNLTSLPSGCYYVVVTTANGTETHKLIIK